MNRARSVTLLLASVAILGFFVLFVGNPFSSPPVVASPPYQVAFLGESGNQTQAARNSTVSGSFELNMTRPSKLKITLGEEKYYPPGSVGNGSTSFTVVDTFRNGSISSGEATYILGTIRYCTATAVSTQTVGNTIKEEVTCNASTISPQFGTEIRETSAGVSEFAYSIQVPANATDGTYLIDIVVQGQALDNFAVQSGNLVYVLSVSVS